MLGTVLLLLSIFLPAIAGFEFTSKSWDVADLGPGFPPLKVLNVGESVNITCQTTDEVNATVDLLFGRSLPYPTFAVLNDDRLKKFGQMFTLFDLKASDHGVYKCMATNGDGEKPIELEKGLLLVTSPRVKKEKKEPEESVEPPLVPKITVNKKEVDYVIKLKEGDKINLKCEVKGQKSLHWFQKDNKGGMVKVDDRLVTGHASSHYGVTTEFLELSIYNFTADMINDYTCKRMLPGQEETSANVFLALKGYCQMDGRLHQIYKRFVTSTCRGRCSCDSETSISCVSLCPPHQVQCGPGFMEVSEPELVSASPICHCPRKKCVSMKKYCIFEGQTYKTGERFISKGCASCRCKGTTVSCVSLCPPQQVTCGSDEMEHYEVKVKSEEPKCLCRRPTCVKKNDVCKMAPESGSCYASFSRYHFNSTSNKCEKFIYGGCEGNPNRFVRKSGCEEMCTDGDRTVVAGYRDEKTPGDCEYEGKWYRKGETFVTKHCREKCMCSKTGTVRCNRFCPHLRPMTCPKGSMVVETSELLDVKQNPSCFCKKQSCVKIADVCKMPPVDGSCYAHIRRWYYNPLSEKCSSFIYGGCEGNANNFLDEDQCKETCESIKETSKTFMISGKIKFTSADDDKLPLPSCASMKLLDTSSNRVEEAYTWNFVVSDMDKSQGIEYQVLMNTDTGPSNKTFSLSVVVNSGWCKDEMSAHWVKDGDYVSLKASEIVISNDKMNYEKDIHVSQIPPTKTN